MPQPPLGFQDGPVAAPAPGYAPNAGSEMTAECQCPAVLPLKNDRALVHSSPRARLLVSKVEVGEPSWCS